jgi:hypothetical protein
MAVTSSNVELRQRSLIGTAALDRLRLNTIDTNMNEHCGIG